MAAACIIQGLTILLFLVLGVVFSRGKGKWLIAGYNTMSEAERARYNEKKLMKIMGSGMFFFSGCMAISLAGMLFWKPLIMTGYGLLAAASVVLAVLANTKAKR